MSLNKIYCGDSLKILSEIENNSVHLIITSPPYNLNKEYLNCSDGLIYTEYLDWMKENWNACKKVLIKGGRLCVNIGENKRNNITFPTFNAFITQCIDLGYLYRGTIIWNKNSSAKHCAWGSWKSPSNPHLVPRHEYILVFSKGDYKLEGNGNKATISAEEFMEFTRTVWNFGTESKKKIGHPAPFPVELPRRLIEFYTFENQIVMDIFSGSGTVGVASVQLNRNYILIDNCSDYCDLAQKRIAKEKKTMSPLHNSFFKKKSLSPTISPLWTQDSV